MKNKVIVVLSLVALGMLLLYTGCREDDGNGNQTDGNNDSGNNGSNPNELFSSSSYGIAVQNGNVYVVGYYSDMNVNDTTCYWANGTRKELSLPDNVTQGLTTGIAVEGGNVYVSGRYSADIYTMMYAYRRPCYWVNGTRIDLPLPDGAQACETTGITVQNGTVYVSGEYWKITNSGYSTSGHSACYWVNGTVASLPVPSGKEGRTTGIAVEGNNVYVSGRYSGSLTDSTGCYWVNGTRTDLPAVGGYNYSITSGIAVQNGNVYVSGKYMENDYDGSTCYWLNGTKTDLPVPNGTYGGDTTTGIAVQNGNIYVSGTYFESSVTHPCYWANGTRTNLPVFGGNDYGITSGIAVQGGNVYVSGHHDGPLVFQACYWANGTKVDLQ